MAVSIKKFAIVAPGANNVMVSLMRMRFFYGGFLLVLLSLLNGCSQQEIKLSNLAKSDIDFVADASYRMCEERLKELTIKLYKRNPRELKKTPINNRQARVNQLFGTPGVLSFPELEGASGIRAMDLALNENYQGDRVFALMAGLIDMFRNAYNYKTEFYMLDELDHDKLYRSARNLEVLDWRLATTRSGQGKLLLLTNSKGDEPRNLSYERLFGELMAIQDLMAEVIAQKNHRLINKVTINAASLVFFPL